jgi:hypothetical protein
MQGPTRLRQIVFWTMSPILVLGGLGFGWGQIGYWGLRQVMVSGVTSPGAAFRASIWNTPDGNRFGCPGCTNQRGDTSVVLESKLWFFSFGWANLFEANVPPEQIQVRWTGRTTLSIFCNECPPDGFDAGPRIWRGVSVRYVITQK